MTNKIALLAAVAAFSLAAASALSVTTIAAFAAEEAAKPTAPAGPTVAAAQAFCGEPSGKADELAARYATAKGLKEIYKSNQYLAYSDDEKSPTRVYTFTVKGHPAHPAAVCRQIVKEGDAVTVKMVVVCDGEAGKCADLQNDFNVMTAKMQVEADQRMAADKK